MMKSKKDIGSAKGFLTGGAIVLFIELMGLAFWLFLWIHENTILLGAIPFFLTIFVLFLLINYCITGICDCLSIVEIDEKSITNKNKYIEETLLLKEIKDFGIVSGFNLYDGFTRYIYFSGRRFSRKCKKDSYKFAKSLGVPIYKLRPLNLKSRHPIFLSTYIRKKQNQKKEDIVIFFHYTDEWWEYICSLEFFKEKRAECEELLQENKEDTF